MLQLASLWMIWTKKNFSISKEMQSLLFNKVSLKDFGIYLNNIFLVAGVSCFFPFKNYMELLCTAQIELFCVGGFLGESSNFGSLAKERLGYGK